MSNFGSPQMCSRNCTLVLESCFLKSRAWLAAFKLSLNVFFSTPLPENLIYLLKDKYRNTWWRQIDKKLGLLGISLLMLKNINPQEAWTQIRLKVYSCDKASTAVCAKPVCFPLVLGVPPSLTLPAYCFTIPSHRFVLTFARQNVLPSVELTGYFAWIPYQTGFVPVHLARSRLWCSSFGFVLIGQFLGPNGYIWSFPDTTFHWSQDLLFADRYLPWNHCFSSHSSFIYLCGHSYISADLERL